MRKIACQCGAVIPSRQVYDCYRLTPRHREVREHHHLGFSSSFLKRFMDRSEAATRHGETVLCLAALAAPGSRNEPRYRWILQYCKSVGYLEYVCPQCEQMLYFHIKREKKRRRKP